MLDTALDLFSQHGFDGTSLQLIADRLGVTKAAVYYHFHTKDEILAALVDPSFDELEQLAADSAAARPSARREDWLARYIDYLLGHRAVTQYLSQDIAALTRPIVWERAQLLSGKIESLVTGDPHGARAQLWGSAVLRGLIGAVLSSPDADDEWLRIELNEIGHQLILGYRKAQRRDQELAGHP